MFIDTTKRSKGHIVVLADVRGSYGEVVNAQIGRSYKDVQVANAAAQRLAAKGMRGVSLHNLNNHWRRTINV